MMNEEQKKEIALALSQGRIEYIGNLADGVASPLFKIDAYVKPQIPAEAYAETATNPNMQKSFTNGTNEAPSEFPLLGQQWGNWETRRAFIDKLDLFLATYKGLLEVKLVNRGRFEELADPQRLDYTNVKGYPGLFNSSGSSLHVVFLIDDESVAIWNDRLSDASLLGDTKIEELRAQYDNPSLPVAVHYFLRNK